MDKRTIISFMVLAYSVQGLWSQSLNDGMYSKKWEEDRDEMNNNSLRKEENSAAYVAAQKSFWSLSSYNTANWEIPVHTSKGWTTERADGKVGNVKISNQSSYKATQAQKKAKRDAEIREFGEQKRERIAEAQAEARRKDAERKRRIAAENAADRQMGYARHTAMMSGFYSQKYARDQYMMNEGARRLDESIHAMDFANVAEQKVEVMKGDELADMLNGYEMQYKRIQAQLKDIDFKSGDRLAVTGNIEMDEEVLEKWSRANMESNIVDLKGKKNNAKAKQPELLVSKDELCLDSFDLFILPQYGLVILTGDSMRVLKDYELRAVSWADGKRYSYIIPCGDKLIGRDDLSIYDIKKANSAKLLEFDTSDFSLFAGNDSTVYSVFWYGDISSIFKINVKTCIYNEIARIPAFIWKVESNGTEAFVMIDNTILVLDESETPHMLYKSDGYISDVTLSPWGLLIATDKEIVRIKSANDCETFYPIATKHIWCDGNEVYIQSKEGNLLYMENGADYITN